MPSTINQALVILPDGREAIENEIVEGVTTIFCYDNPMDGESIPKTEFWLDRMGRIEGVRFLYEISI